MKAAVLNRWHKEVTIDNHLNVSFPEMKKALGPYLRNRYLAHLGVGVVVFVLLLLLFLGWGFFALLLTIPGNMIVGLGRGARALMTAMEVPRRGMMTTKTTARVPRRCLWAVTIKTLAAVAPMQRQAAALLPALPGPNLQPTALRPPAPLLAFGLQPLKPPLPLLWMDLQFK